MERREWYRYTLYMYVQKCFQVVYYQPLLLDIVLGSAIKSGWDWQKVGLHAQKSIPAKPIASFHMPNP